MRGLRDCLNSASRTRAEGKSSVGMDEATLG